MAKPARGLPSNFALDLPDERPVMIGDFLDEPPPVLQPPKRVAPQTTAPEPVRTEAVYEPDRETGRFARSRPAPVPERKPAAQKVIRYQLNLNPKSKKMFEELVEHVQTYSTEPDTRPSEIFQGIIGLLHGALDELDLATLPRRGAWGSVTAKNFPGSLGEAFENAIIRSARRRGGGL
jgi:hypothetical protein